MVRTGCHPSPATSPSMARAPPSHGRAPPGTAAFRLFYVSGGLEANLPAGKLTLMNVVLTGGLAQGGAGGNAGAGGSGGGGAAGMGGAIFNEGTVVLNAVTNVGNKAI